MMIHLAKTGQTFAIDTREKAPAGATPDMFVGVPNASLQGVAVGVPGMVRGTALALERYGKLSLAQVHRSRDQARRRRLRGNAALRRRKLQHALAATRPSRRRSSAPNGVPPVVGSLVQNKPLAETLRLIADPRPGLLLQADPGQGLRHRQGHRRGPEVQPSAGAQRQGRQHDVRRPGELPGRSMRAPVEGTYRGYTIKSMSPPSSGGLTMIQMLKMLERFPIGDASQGYGFGSLKTVNVMADAMRLAFADRSIWMGDADFVPVPAKGLLAPGYMRCAARPIVPGARLMPNPTPGDPRPFEMAGVEPATRPGRGRAGDRPRRDDDALLGGRQVGQHGLVHEHHRVVARHRRVRRLQARPMARSATTASCSTTS